MHTRLRWYPVVLLHLLLLTSLLSHARHAYADPAMLFIVAADSVAREEGDDALADLVAENAPIVGAAVAQLIDVGLEVGRSGEVEAKKENLEFALRVARLHAVRNERSGPLDLAQTALGWTEAQQTRRAAAKALEDEARRARDAREFGRAVEIIADAQAIYREIDDAWSLAVTHGTLGVLYWYAGDFEAVERSYQDALAARRAVDDRILVGRTLNGLGTVRIIQSLFAEAVPWYERAIAMRRSTGDTAGLLTSLNYLGQALDNAGRTVEARRVFEEEALPLVVAAQDAVAEAELHIGIATLYERIGSLQASAEHFRQAIDAAVRSGEPRTIVGARVNFVNLLRSMDRLGEAEDQLDAIESMLEEFSAEEEDYVRGTRAQVAQSRGAIRARIGDYESARTAFRIAISEADASQDPRLRAETRIGLGYALGDAGAPARALPLTAEAQEICQRNGLVLGLFEATALEMSLAVLQKDPDRLLEAVERGAALADSTQNPEHALLVEIYRASQLAMVEEREGARGVLHDLLASDPRALNSGFRSAILCAIGDTFEADRPDSAAIYYDRALEVVERERRASATVGSLAGYFDREVGRVILEILDFYARMDREDPDAGWSARAFEVAERRKARDLLDEIAADVRLNDDPSFAALLDSLYSIDRSRPDAAALARHVEARIARARADALANSNPGASMVSLADVQATLHGDELLVQYALGDSTTYAWIVTRDDTRLVSLPARAGIESDVRAMRDAMARPGFGDEVLRDVASRLYEHLLPEDLVEPGEGRLIVVPDGALHELPFEALIHGGGDASSWTDVDFLGARTPIVYAPSSSVFVAGRRGGRDVHGRERRSLRFAAFGNPDFSDLPPRPGIDPAQLVPLAGSEEEVQSAAALVDASQRVVYLGASATEERWKEIASDYSVDVLHVATHGIVDPREPDRSCVVLARGDGGTDDGYLYTLEVLETNLDADLVVLSACESGRGRIRSGEGVVGLGRAFLGAGARQLVASLWKVDDASTARLMKIFYERVFENSDPVDVALMRARNAMIASEDTAHPFHWAAFVAIGAGADNGDTGR